MNVYLLDSLTTLKMYNKLMNMVVPQSEPCKLKEGNMGAFEVENQIIEVYSTFIERLVKDDNKVLANKQVLSSRLPTS